MTDFDKIKGLIATGDKQTAIPMLASILLKNKDEAEAWLLLGDLIDDPRRKKDCYDQVLRLSPGNSLALTKLGELGEPSPSVEPITSPGAAPKTAKNSLNGVQQSSRLVPEEATRPFENHSQSDTDKTGYIIGGIIGVGLLVFLIIMFLMGNTSDPFSGINPLWGILLLLAIMGGIFLWASNNKNG